LVIFARQREKLVMHTQEQAIERPWQALDPAVSALVEPALGAIADEITEAIAASIPAYRVPMGGSFGRGVRTAIEETLRQFLAQIGRPASGELPGREVYLALGRGEYRAGRPLDALQGAYRLGARVAWRRFSAVAREGGLDAATLSLLAESIFAYIDEISAESVEGYASEQAASAGERQRARQALVRILLAGGELDASEVEAAAAAADWPLPRRLGVLVADHRDAERLASLVGEGAIAARIDDLVCVLVGDPDAPGRRGRLERALEGRRTALGPTVAWPDAPRSWARAARCVRLAQVGQLPDGRLVLASKSLGTLALHSEPELLAELAAARLAPFDDLTAAARMRAETTLLAWLRRQGNVAAVAAELGVHPQTVRYRVARLRELLGAALEDPDARFEFELALRARAPARRGAGAGVGVQGGVQDA
jgi:hypothetical protein